MRRYHLHLLALRGRLRCWHLLLLGGPMRPLNRRPYTRSCRLQRLLLHNTRQRRRRKRLPRFLFPLLARRVLLSIPLRPPNPLQRPARRLYRRWRVSKRPLERTPLSLLGRRRRRVAFLPLPPQSNVPRHRQKVRRSRTRTCEKFSPRSMTLRKPARHG